MSYRAIVSITLLLVAVQSAWCDELFYFAPPEKLGPAINQPDALEGAPRLTADGLSLYFVGDAPDGTDNDIWVSQRRSLDAEWEPSVPVTELNTSIRDDGPAISTDELELYFFSSSQRDPESGDCCIFVSRRDSVDEQWGPASAVTIPRGEGDPEVYWAPSISQDGLTLYLTGSFDADDLTTSDLFVATRETTDSPWRRAESLGPAVNSTAADIDSSIANDGRTLVFSSCRGQEGNFGGACDLWVSHRPDATSSWTAAENLGPTINSPDHVDRHGILSTDGSEFYFQRVDVSGTGLNNVRWSTSDIWRSKVSSGDRNGNGAIDGEDIDSTRADPVDFNLDGVINSEDRAFWVSHFAQSFFGDANLDGEFNSGDLVDVFAAGHYEDDLIGNSGWASGDWTGDGEFDTSDLVRAFQDGGYEQGPQSAIQAVPEPTSLVTILTALATLLVTNRGSRKRGRGVHRSLHLMRTHRPTRRSQR